MDNDHHGMSRRIQRLEYNQKMIASCIADLSCMVPTRPDTLPTEGQDWFESKLGMITKNMQDIVHEH